MMILTMRNGWKNKKKVVAVTAITGMAVATTIHAQVVLQDVNTFADVVAVLVALVRVIMTAHLVAMAPVRIIANMIRRVKYATAHVMGLA